MKTVTTTEQARRSIKESFPLASHIRQQLDGGELMKNQAEQVTVFSFIGSLGCIRFPVPIRQVSGIKRGDRLAVGIQGANTIILEKLEIPNSIPTEAIQVDGCTCSQVPEGCSKGKPNIVSVGWSYVKLTEALANKLRFLPESPIKLIGEPSRITVSLHTNRRDLKGVAKVVCPP